MHKGKYVGSIILNFFSEPKRFTLLDRTLHLCTSAKWSRYYHSLQGFQPSQSCQSRGV